MRTWMWSGDRDELAAAARTYSAVFSAAPYDEEPQQLTERFTERVLRYAGEKPHLRLALAGTPQLGVAGLVLGVGAAEGDWWWDRVSRSTDAPTRQRWLGDACFSVAEVAVDPRIRRRGAASALLPLVLEGLPYRTATLTCLPGVPAVAFYGSQGWRAVGPPVDLGDGVPRLLMARDLPGDA